MSRLGASQERYFALLLPPDKSELYPLTHTSPQRLNMKNSAWVTTGSKCRRVNL